MNIRTLRLKKGWTQQDLADKLGVSQQTIAKWENKKGLPTVDKLPAIAKVFCVPIEVLYKEGM